MKVEHSTKVMWGAVVPFCVIYMLVMFTEYIDAGPCHGFNTDCTHITFTNGTRMTVPAGQVASETKDLTGPMPYALLAVAFMMVMVARWTARQSRDPGASKPTFIPQAEVFALREEETDALCGPGKPRKGTDAGGAASTSTGSPQAHGDVPVVVLTG